MPAEDSEDAEEDAEDEGTEEVSALLVEEKTGGALLLSAPQEAKSANTPKARQTCLDIFPIRNPRCYQG